jgi:hypothetical protein
MRVPRTPRARVRTPWVIGGALLVVVAGVLAWVLWPGDDGPDPRARVYTDASACLLTPAAGVVDKAAAPVWAGMQQASLATRGKVSFLEVDGPQTGDNAKSYLATLVSGGCDLVLVAGAAPLAALDSSATSYPKVRFVAVGGGTASPNVSVVAGTDPATITERVRSLVDGVLTSAAR